MRIHLNRQHCICRQTSGRMESRLLFAICGLVLTLLPGSAAEDSTRPSCQPGAQVPPTRTNTTVRVAQLRDAMRGIPGLYAVIIPTADDHQNEYVGLRDKKRAFISGFSGSAGTAVVTLDSQLLWTDGRYFLQAADELDCDWMLMRSGEKDVPSLTEWITANVPSGKAVGADAKVISTRSWKSYVDTFGKKGVGMQHTGDLVSPVWENSEGGQPLPVNNEVYPLELQYAGRTWQEKIADLRNKLGDSSADAVVVSALDEVAWLFNLRGSDIAYNPVFFAYAIIERDVTKSPTLYLRDATHRIPKLKSHLNTTEDGQCATAQCVKIAIYEEVDDGVRYFNGAMVNATIWISDSTNYHITSLVDNQKRILDSPSPLLLMKAIKNPIEREGMRRSHIRDSAVIVKFISNLEKELDEGIYWDELKVAETIDNLRKAQDKNKGLSFGTIAGSGKNGAYIHYTPTVITNNVVNKSNMLLLDSGGQYLDGTTDITRTFHFGQPTDFQKLAYTLVLLGVIDLAMVKFPANRTLGSSLDMQARKAFWSYGLDYRHGTGHGIGMFLNVHEGSSLDALARRPLWEHGLDFGHGTGHGIGMFLNVHEGPARIAPRRASGAVSDERPIYDGMFFSDEPGYYDDSRGFGVRLETIIMASYVDTQYGTPNSTLEFETIALVPFEKKLIKLEMLDENQRRWLNTYHQKCLEKTGAALNSAGETAAFNWLKERTSPVPLPGETTTTVTTTAGPTTTMPSTKPPTTTQVKSCDCTSSNAGTATAPLLVLAAMAILVSM